jgi:hypothetical protein
MRGAVYVDWREKLRCRMLDDSHTTAPSTRRLRSVPRDGDVLASKRTARADVYTISVVPGAGHTSVRRYSEAIDTVQELAQRLGVDGWFTCNHTHYARVAMHRTERF